MTWLGHGTCLFRSPGGKRLLVDPWLKTNPSCPPAWHQPTDVDAVLVTHGHSDHIEDAASVARATNADVIANFEIVNWLAKKGVKKGRPMNKGGTQVVGDVRVTMVDALHSSSYEENGVNHYLGEAAGFVLRFDTGPTLYFAGDTAVFGDMRLIADLYAPQIACLPIGDLFTMGPERSRIRVRHAARETGAARPLGHLPGVDRDARRAACARRRQGCSGARPEARRDGGMTEESSPAVHSRHVCACVQG